MTLSSIHLTTMVVDTRWISEFNLLFRLIYIFVEDEVNKRQQFKKK